MLLFRNNFWRIFIQVTQVLVDFFSSHCFLLFNYFAGNFFIGLWKILRDSFNMALVLKFGKDVFINFFKILFHNVYGLNIFINIEVLKFLCFDNVEFDNHIIRRRAAIFKSNEISVWLNVNHFSLGGHVDESKTFWEVPEHFGTVAVESLNWRCLVVEVGLIVIGEFEDHLSLD